MEFDCFVVFLYWTYLYIFINYNVQKKYIPNNFGSYHLDIANTYDEIGEFNNSKKYYKICIKLSPNITHLFCLIIFNDFV